MTERNGFSRATAYMQIAPYAVSRPSVSVTWVDQSKTVEVSIVQFSPYSRPIALVFAE